MTRLEIEGCAIHYEVDGAGDAPWLMLSNSLGTNLALWDGQVDALADRFRILRYDSRGHGRSEAPPGPYSLERLGRDALALLDYLGVEETSFAGISMGGMVGMWLAANAPARIARLALCNTAARLGPPELWDQRIAAVNESGMAAVADSVIERWLTPAFRQAEPDAAERLRAMLLATQPQGYAGCCAAIRDMDQLESIRKIHAPTLIIAGVSDPATPPALSEEIAMRVEGARLVVLEAAHLSNVEAEDAFNAALERFLTEESE